MRFRSRLGSEYGLKQVAIVPLINVVFLLLIFFILTSGMVAQPAGVKVDLPKLATTEAMGFGNIEIGVSSSGQVYFNTGILTTEQLEGLFKQAARRNQPILIKADSGVPIGIVSRIWDKARDLGVSKINIATNQQR